VASISVINDWLSPGRTEIEMKLFAIRRRSAWADAAELGTVAAKSTDVGDKEMSDRVRWIRSYVVAEPDGRLGTICIYEAQDEAALREHAARVGMPGDEIDSIADTVVVRPDPTAAAVVA
jgi:uncharacterized protein DUF4242